mgnify:CR=1 FL=1
MADDKEIEGSRQIDREDLQISGEEEDDDDDDEIFDDPEGFIDDIRDDGKPSYRITWVQIVPVEFLAWTRMWSYSDSHK